LLGLVTAIYLLGSYRADHDAFWTSKSPEQSAHELEEEAR